jgi:hypothetical protein
MPLVRESARPAAYFLSDPEVKGSKPYPDHTVRAQRGSLTRTRPQGGRPFIGEAKA